MKGNKDDININESKSKRREMLKLLGIGAGVGTLVSPALTSQSFAQSAADLAEGVVSLASYGDFRGSINGFSVSDYSDGQMICFTNDGIAGIFILKSGTLPDDNEGTIIRSNVDTSRYVERIHDSQINVS